MMTDQIKHKIEELVALGFDGQLSVDQQKQLNLLLIDSAEAMEYYCKLVELQNSIAEPIIFELADHHANQRLKYSIILTALATAAVLVIAFLPNNMESMDTGKLPADNIVIKDQSVDGEIVVVMAESGVFAEDTVFDAGLAQLDNELRNINRKKFTRRSNSMVAYKSLMYKTAKLKDADVFFSEVK